MLFERPYSYGSHFLPHDAVSERGGLQFFVFESRSTNQDGETVCTGTWTNIVR